MAASQRVKPTALQITEIGLPPLQVQIELSFPQSSPQNGHDGSCYSVLVSEAPLQDIAISHLISMLKKLMFSFSSESLRSALDAIESLGSLKAQAKAGPHQVPRPGGCEFTDCRERPVSSPKSLGNMATGLARSVGAWARRRRSEICLHHAETEEPIRVGDPPTANEAATRSLPLGIQSVHSKEGPGSTIRSRAATNRGSAEASSSNSLGTQSSGAEKPGDNFVKDLPLTLTPAGRSSAGSTTLVLSSTLDPRARPRKDKVEDEDDAHTLPSIAELPESEEFAPASGRTFANSAAATLGNPNSRRPSSRCPTDWGNVDYLCFQAAAEDGEPPNAPYLPGEVWPTPGGYQPDESSPSPHSDAVDWLLQLRAEADDGPPDHL